MYTIDSISVALGVVALSVLLPLGPARFRRRRPTQNDGHPQPTKKTSNMIRATVTAYSLLALLFWYTTQVDLFTRLRLPLTATGDQIRSALVTQRPKEFIPLDLQVAYDRTPANGLSFRSRSSSTSHPLFTPALDRVLQRIETFDVRMMYNRLGHAVVQECEWCNGPEDYFVFGAAGLGLAYGALFLVVGVVTEAGERRKSRVWAVGLVAVVLGFDVFWTGFVKAGLKRGENIPYHVRAQRLRLLLHIFLPNILLLLPHNNTYLSQETYMNTLQALSALTQVSNAQQTMLKHARYAGLVREASVSTSISRNVDGALRDEELRAKLDSVRPLQEGEESAVERLRGWAAKAAAEVVSDLQGMIPKRDATPVL